MNERFVQLEFRVVVQVPGDSWPHEVADEMYSTLGGIPDIQIMSVDQIMDYA